MIRKLKLKFVVLAMTALFALLTMIVTGMNLINYGSVVEEADMILSVLSQNKGAFPDFEGEQGGQEPVLRGALYFFRKFFQHIQFLFIQILKPGIFFPISHRYLLPFSPYSA